MSRLPKLQYVAVTDEPATTVITLNRPERHNAASPALIQDLLEALEYASGQQKALILTGAGKSFCAGHDLKEPSPAQDPSHTLEHVARLRRISELLQQPGMISIAAIHGYALGAGLEIAMSCDLLVADPQATFGFPEVSVGLSVTGGASLILPQLVGMVRAKELMLLGRWISAKQAHEYGLVTNVCDPAAALSTAHAYAEQLAALPPNALATSKMLLHQHYAPGWSQAMVAESVAAMSTGFSTEYTQHISGSASPAANTEEENNAK